MDQLQSSINRDISRYIESQLDQFSQDQKQYFTQKEDAWRVNRDSLEKQLQERNSHIDLLEQRLATLQEELDNLKKVSYIQMITKQLADRDRQFEILQHRFEKSQELIESLKRSNYLLNQKIENLPTDGITSSENNTDVNTLENEKTEVASETDAGTAGATTPAEEPEAQETEKEANVASGEVAKTPEEPEAQETEKEARASGAEKQAIPEGSTKKNVGRVVVWDGERYSVKPKQIRKKKYLVVSEVVDGEERWIFKSDHDDTKDEAIGKVTPDRKIVWF